MKKLYEVGGEYWRVEIYECESCHGETQNWFETDEGNICPDCAFKKGICTEKEYLKAYGIQLETARATIHEGEIYVVLKGKFPFEKTNTDYRHTTQYTEWRAAVFERDGFKCQECGAVGGKLNAHHINTFKDYPKLRYEVSNGITLCEKCHRELHKRIRYAGKKDVHKKDNRK